MEENKSEHDAAESSSGESPPEAVEETATESPPQDAAPDAGDTAYAGFWKRVVAYIIDAVILAIPSVLIAYVGGEALGNLASFLIGWLYFASLESSYSQATFGKQALAIKVTDLDGNRISFGKATGRFFGKIISGIILAIGFIMVAFTQKKQGLHDIMAGCLVVNAK